MAFPARTAITALLLLGCGDAPPGKGGAGDLAAAPDLGHDATMETFIAITGLVYETPAQPPATKLVPGFEVCVLDRSDLACSSLTGLDGRYVIEKAPAGVESGLVFSKAGYLTGVALGRNELFPFILNVNIPPDDLAARFAHAANLDYPPHGTSYVLISVLTGSPGNTTGLSNLTATLVNHPENHPIYFNEAGLPDPGLPATTKDGELAFANVTPGPFDVTLTDSGLDCDSSGTGWHPMNAHSFHGKVVANALVHIFANCHHL